MQLHIHKLSEGLLTSCEVLKTPFYTVKVTEPEKLACVGKLGLHLTVNCLIISLQIPSPSSVLGADFLIECFAIQMCLRLWHGDAGTIAAGALW
jgi:hypothetical protein